MICIALKNSRLYVKVREEDAPEMQKYEWRAIKRDGKYYAYRMENGKKIYMDRLLAKPPKGMKVNHIDGDTLNNHPSNFEFVLKSKELIEFNHNFCDEQRIVEEFLPFVHVRSPDV